MKMKNDPNLELRFQRNLQQVEESIIAACEEAGRSRDEVTLICVVKKRPLEEVWALYNLCDQPVFAENRPQEARDRIPEFPDDIQWHFVGSLQKNKVKYLPGLVHWVHSVHSPGIATALDAAWEKRPELELLNVLLQFNISGEEQKKGAGVEEALELLCHVDELPNLKVQGLMCMAPYTEDPEESRPVFAALRELRDRLEQESGLSLPHLSMGMTNDFKQAILEGATLVRVGTGLFTG